MKPITSVFKIEKLMTAVFKMKPMTEVCKMKPMKTVFKIEKPMTAVF